MEKRFFSSFAKFFPRLQLSSAFFYKLEPLAIFFCFFFLFSFLPSFLPSFTHSFIHSFIRLFIRFFSFVRFIQPFSHSSIFFVRSVLHWFTHSYNFFRLLVRLSFCSFVRSFIRLLFVRLLVHSFVRLFIRLFDRSFVRFFVRSFVRLFVCLFVCSIVRFVRSFVCPFVCSVVHSFVCSFVHFVCLCAMQSINGWNMNELFSLLCFWQTRKAIFVTCVVFIPTTTNSWHCSTTPINKAW